MIKYVNIFLFIILSILSGCVNQEQVSPECKTSDSLAIKSDTVLSDTNAKDSVVLGKHCAYYKKLRSSTYLRDPNKLHIMVGREMGLEKPFRKNADFLAERDSILENHILMPLSDGEYYKLKELRHSYPYLTKEAIELLEEVSRRFQINLQKKNQPNYSILVTSALRTEESQSGLRRNNRNATRDTTSHLFGASFDISYWEFYRNNDGNIYRYKNLQNILMKTIREIRNEKKCLVIKETGQFCFHLTVIR